MTLVEKLHILVWKPKHAIIAYLPILARQFMKFLLMVEHYYNYT